MSPSPKTATSGRGDEIATVRIELRGSDPPIWREVEVPTAITLKVLHDVVQAVMGWLDGHLWEFTIGEQRYGLPMDEDWGTAPRTEAMKARLRDVLNPGVTTIDYLYDFGDSWEHRLTVTGVGPGDPQASYPRYVAGERNAPPEDCGGIPGFYDMLDALADPRLRRRPAQAATAKGGETTRQTSRKTSRLTPPAHRGLSADYPLYTHWGIVNRLPSLYTLYSYFNILISCR